jgi:hypothetical protein
MSWRPLFSPPHWLSNSPTTSRAKCGQRNQRPGRSTRSARAVRCSRRKLATRVAPKRSGAAFEPLRRHGTSSIPRCQQRRRFRAPLGCTRGTVLRCIRQTPLPGPPSPPRREPRPTARHLSHSAPVAALLEPPQVAPSCPKRQPSKQPNACTGASRPKSNAAAPGEMSPLALDMSTAI